MATFCRRRNVAFQRARQMPSRRAFVEMRPKAILCLFYRRIILYLYKPSRREKLVGDKKWNPLFDKKW